MRAVIQRVSSCNVVVNETMVARIDAGVLIFLGIEDSDEQTDIEWLSRKIINMRIFNDSSGVMNNNILEVNGDILVVSQFTLHASTKKGNRPSYIRAARPEIARELYESFIDTCSVGTGKKVLSGEFGANMQVSIVNDGPVTILLDSKNKE